MAGIARDVRRRSSFVVAQRRIGGPFEPVQLGLEPVAPVQTFIVKDAVGATGLCTMRFLSVPLRGIGQATALADDWTNPSCGPEKRSERRFAPLFRVVKNWPAPSWVTLIVRRMIVDCVPVLLNRTTRRSPAPNPQLLVQLVSSVMLGPVSGPVNVATRSMSWPVVAFRTV